jgi:hypothetical protein
MNMYQSINELDRRLAERKHRTPVTQGQTAAVNLMPLVDEVLDLARRSKAGQALPRRVSDDIYPGGILPPGDVVEIEHYTRAPGGQLPVLDPAQWGSRQGPALSFRNNAEGPRMQANPEMFNVQGYLPAYGARPEKDIATGSTGVVRGAVPGMYNLTKDPDNLLGQIKAKHALDQAAMGKEGPFAIPLDDTTKQLMVEQEARRRGYTGVYRTDLPTSYKASASMLTPVDTRGAAPNIAAMRDELGLPVGAGAPEREFPDIPRYAQVNTETMPGAANFAERYRGYEQSPSAAAMLHADYEQLLRNPDGSSVVAAEFGRDAPVRQAQGVYAGQRNPVAAARVPVTPPKITPDMDPDMIAEKAVLPQRDVDTLDAIALTEGLLRDQDAVAWNMPFVLTPEKQMAREGIPWESVNTAVFASPGLRHKEVGMAADKLRQMPLSDEVAKQFEDWAGEGGVLTWEDLIAVTEPPSGTGGVQFTNISGMPPQAFQNAVRQLRDQFPSWVSSRNMETQWGRAQTGFYSADEYAERIKTLPPELRAKVERTLEKYAPHVDRIRRYHDELRGVGQ